MKTKLFEIEELNGSIADLQLDYPDYARLFEPVLDVLFERRRELMDQIKQLDD